MIFSIKPQIFELKCVFSYFRLKTHITLLLPVYVHSWEQRKLGEVFQEYSEKNHPELPALTIIQGGGTVLREESERKLQYDKSSLAGYKMVREDDFIVHLRSFEGGLEKSNHNGLISPAYHTFHGDEVDSRFYYPYFRSYEFIKHKLVPHVYGIRDGRSIDIDSMKTIEIPWTSYEEQKKIGDYIESLDTLITLHQCKCQIDGCRFQSPLAITWEQRKVREVTDRYDNLRIPVAASLRVAGTTPYYGANGIQDYVDGYTHDGEFILVAEDGANDLKNYPVKCVKGRIWVNNHAHVLQGKYDCADNQFLAYAISQADIESLLVGGGRAKLNAETLMGIDLLLPNKAEQIRIGKYLAQLDNLITLHQCE